MRVLLVDDSEDMRLLVGRALRRRGHEVTACADAEEAWEIARDQAFPLVILDWLLPGMDGLELCRRLRATPNGERSVTLLVTAQAAPEDLVAVLDAGASDYLAKPFTPGMLDVRLAVAERRVAESAARARAEEALEQLARTDPLTNLANRRAASEELVRLLGLARRQGQQVAVALVDLDHFKAVNDRFGHAAGDAVLRRFAALLADAIRDTDVAARWGGEEFLVGLYGCDAASAARRLEALLASMRREVFPGPTAMSFGVTFSAGVAVYPRDGMDLESLYRAADAALYRAKAAGRDRVQLANPPNSGGFGRALVKVRAGDGRAVKAPSTTAHNGRSAPRSQLAARGAGDL